MSSQRDRLVKALRTFAVLLELDGANSFKSNAYVRGARALADADIDIGTRLADGTLTDIDGVGKGLAEKVAEFWAEGRIAEMDVLAARFPEGLVRMTDIPGFGPKKARAVHDELAVSSIAELEAACQDGRVAKLKGFGEKTAQKILQGIDQLRKHAGRFHIDVADAAAAPVLAMLRAHPAVQQVEIAGSLRRRMDTVKDLDFVCATGDAAAVMDAFVSMPGVQIVTGRGDTKASVVLDSGMAADLRCVGPAHFPFTLQHFSGSKEHNTALRARAKQRGLKSSEYGLFPEGIEESLPAATEAEIYRHLGLDFIPPELREDMGEIEAAEKGELPQLVTAGDMRGLPHNHTHFSDGEPDPEDYARWLHENGMEWLGIADHSTTAAYAGGLKPERVLEEWKVIDEVNLRWKAKGVRLLKGTESDILADGSLDYDDGLLAQFEYVVASVHSQFNLAEEKQTSRLIAAVDSPFTTILGHMTGRLLLKRDGYQVNQKDVIRRCARNGVIVEINANPWRLDLDWRLIRFALDEGCMVCVSPDAHDMAGLRHARFGIDMARKGWVTKDRLANCWTAEELLRHARRHR